MTSIPRTRAVAAVAALTAALGCGCTARPVATSTPVSSNLAGSPATPVSPSPTAELPSVTVTAVPQSKPPTPEVVVDDPQLIELHGEWPLGPEVFSVEGDTLTIDDSVHARLVTYRDGRRVRSVPMPELEPGCLDLLTEGDSYWLMSDGAVGRYQYREGKELRLIEEYRLHNNDNVQWEGGALAREGANLVATPMVGDAELVTGPGPLWPRPTEIASNSRTIKLRDGRFAATITLDTADDEAYARLVGRNERHSWYEVYTGGNPHNWGYVYQFSTAGKLVHTYTLPLPGGNTPDQSLKISDDEQLYMLRITNTTAEVLRIPPNP